MALPAEKDDLQLEGKPLPKPKKLPAPLLIEELPHPRLASKMLPKHRSSSDSSSDLANAVITLTSGGVAGGVSRTLTSPLERLKILFQTQPDPPKYIGIRQSLRLIRQEEGVRGFFRGNGANCARIVPQSAIQFYGYSQFKKLLVDEHGEMTAARRLMAGALAGAVSQMATYPLDMIRARLTIAPKGTYSGMFHAFSMVIRHEGAIGLYKGLAPSLAGIAPYVGLDFAVYETLRELSIVPKQPNGQPTIVAKLVCGGIAGLVGQTVSYPFDLVRRRLQVQGMELAASHTAKAGGGFVMPPDGPRYTGMVDCFVKTIKANGFFGLYRGLLPNYLKAVPAVAVSFVVFEAAHERLVKWERQYCAISVGS